MLLFCTASSLSSFERTVRNPFSLGCTSAKEDDVDNQNTSVEPKPKRENGQQSIDTYFQSQENKNSHNEQNKNHQSPKVSQLQKSIVIQSSLLQLSAKQSHS